jgi:low affinity Fe/Cu permease
MIERQKHFSECEPDAASAAKRLTEQQSKCSPDHFGTFSAWTSKVMGGRWAFLLAALSVVIWAITGPIFHYSENWQLVINTGTTIVTFLMVFLIQNSQNRESKAVHLKLDELILAVRRADNQLINIETLTEEKLDLLGERYRKLGEHYHRDIEREKSHAGSVVEESEAGIVDVDQRAGRNERTLSGEGQSATLH